MNFKESYKKANDKIVGDRSILDEVFEPKKKIITPYFYKMTSLAAAFILVGTVFLMSSFKEDMYPEANDIKAEASGKKEDLPETKIRAKEEADTEIKLNKELEDKELSFDEAASDNAEKDTAAYMSFTEEAAEEKENVKVDETPVIKNEVIESDLVKTDGALMDENDYFAVSGGGGAGGGSSQNLTKPTVSTVTEIKEEKMLTEELLLFLGIPREKLNFDDMVLNLPESVSVTYDEDGNIEGYVINFTLLSEEKKSEEMPLEDKKIEEIIKGDKKIEGILINSVTPVTEEIKVEDGAIVAHKTIGNTDIFIKAYNLEEDEAKRYMDNFN